MPRSSITSLACLFPLGFALPALAGPTDLVPIQLNVPYKTRIIVRWPAIETLCGYQRRRRGPG